MMQFAILLILTCLCSIKASTQKYIELYESKNYLKSYELCKKIVAKDKKNYSAYFYRALNQIKIATDTSINSEFNFYFEQALTTIDFLQTKPDGINLLQKHADDQKYIELECYRKSSNLISDGEIKISERLVKSLLDVNEMPEYLYLNALLKDAQGNTEEALVLKNKVAAKIYLSYLSGEINKPYLPEVFLELAEGIYKTGDKKSAWVILTRALNLFQTNDIFEFSIQLLNSDAMINIEDSMFIIDINFIDTLRKFNDEYSLDEIEFNILKSWLYFQQEKVNPRSEQIIQENICPSPFQTEKFKKEIIQEQIASVDKMGKLIPAKTSLISGTTLDLLFNCNSNQQQTFEVLLIQLIQEYLISDSILIAAKTFAVLKNNFPKSKQLLSIEKNITEKVKNIYAKDSNYFLCSDIANYCGSASMTKILMSNISNQINKLIQEGKFAEAGIIIKSAVNKKPNDEEIQFLFKKWIIEDFNANFESPNYLELYNFNANVSSCDPGKLTVKQQAYFLQTLNYVRRLAGIYNPCTLNEKLNAKCQQAALMMEANFTLSHFPTNDWKCYTIEGASAAGSSNLSLGYSYVNALVGQLEDDGNGNESVGHRRWILNPYNSVFGHGSTSLAMALCVFGTSDYYLQQNNQIENKFIVWPPAGYVPEIFFCERWSISYKYADFTKAKIDIKVNEKKVSFEILETSSGYGLNTIVFVIDPQWLDINNVYNIQISNVLISGSETPLHFNYSVDFIETMQ